MAKNNSSKCLKCKIKMECAHFYKGVQPPCCSVVAQNSTSTNKQMDAIAQITNVLNWHGPASSKLYRIEGIILNQRWSVVDFRLKSKESKKQSASPPNSTPSAEQQQKATIVELVSELEDSVANGEDCHNLVTKLKCATQQL